MRDTCEYMPSWNGFYCIGNDIGVLEWESIGRDAKDLATAPVTIENDYFTNTVNLWREWEWIGSEP